MDGKPGLLRARHTSARFNTCEIDTAGCSLWKRINGAEHGQADFTDVLDSRITDRMEAFFCIHISKKPGQARSCLVSVYALNEEVLTMFRFCLRLYLHDRAACFHG